MRRIGNGPQKTGAYLLALVLTIGLCAASAFAETWKFAVMSDTQWPASPDNKNPNSVSVNVINHLNQEFINHGVKFVIAVGDITDNGSNLALDTTATFRQALYNAGIGFYPLRGNHESSAAAAGEFQRIFPQTQTGINNQTPANAFVATSLYGAPPANTNASFSVGSNFASPSGFEGLTYSFDYKNARFLLLDQFTPASGASHSTLTSSDVNWVNGRLSESVRPAHAFVFSHKGLITENHYDNLFGSDPNASPSLTNSFMASLANNGVRYLFGGHDHMHNRAIVTSPDGLSKVENMILASNSYKFYIPAALGTWSTRETQIAQELFTIGYYIVTVDGPNVTVDYYASPNGCNGDCDLTNDLIPYTFTKRETYGYSLNGKQVLVPQGGSYVLTDNTSKAVTDGEAGYLNTSAGILSGINGSLGADYRGRALTKSVNTGWAQADAGTASDILTLVGLEDSLATDFTNLGNSNLHYQYLPRTGQTDKYVLSMSYNPAAVYINPLSGSFGLSVRDKYRGWVNAVSKNFGGTPNFINGPWVDGYSLGTYGVDTATNTAWAVINHSSEFAIAPMNAVNKAPSVSIILPGQNEVFDSPASITIAANATDSDGTVAKVEFYNGTEKIGEAIAAPFTMTWNGILSGAYNLSAVATDNEGMHTSSDPISILVNNLDNAAPSVVLSSPVDGAKVFAGSSIAIAATASDTDGYVSKVEFYAGDIKLGEDTSAPFVFNWPVVPVGDYALTAVATDNDGASTVSSIAHVSVVTIPAGGTASYFEDFNSMGTTGTTPPAGWSIKNANSGTSNTTWSTSIPANGANSVASMVNAAGSLTATTTPTSTNNNGYNAAAAGVASDRMIATSPTSVAGAAIQLQLLNNSDGYINQLVIGYDIYRINAPSSVNELPGYQVFYSLDNGTSWTNIQALNPTVGGPNGIVVPNTVGVTNVPATPITLSGNWNPGSPLLFRWVDDNGQPTSPDQMYGLDNVSISTPVSLQLGVTTSGFVYSRAAKSYSGTMTFTNTGQTPIREQVFVSFTGLPTGVTVINASGTNNGSPYIAIDLAGDLDPGESISFPVLFNNPANAKINFTPVTYQ